MSHRHDQCPKDLPVCIPPHRVPGRWLFSHPVRSQESLAVMWYYVHRHPTACSTQLCKCACLPLPSPFQNHLTGPQSIRKSNSASAHKSNKESSTSGESVAPVTSDEVRALASGNLGAVVVSLCQTCPRTLCICMHMRRLPYRKPPYFVRF
jgi:hypothetical protein